jgi:DNA-binding transcriptional MerR regulator
MTELERSSRRSDRTRPNRAVADLVGGFERDATGGEVFTIRDLVKELGVSARTLRFYEEKGLVDPRRNGQERLYSRRDRARLKYVLMGKSVGFSLEEVREMLDLYDLGDGKVTQLKVAREKFRERIDRAISELTRACRAIEDMLASAQSPKT